MDRRRAGARNDRAAGTHDATLRRRGGRVEQPVHQRQHRTPHPRGVPRAEAAGEAVEDGDFVMGSGVIFM